MAFFASFALDQFFPTGPSNASTTATGTVRTCGVGVTGADSCSEAPAGGDSKRCRKSPPIGCLDGY